MPSHSMGDLKRESRESVGIFDGKEVQFEFQDAAEKKLIYHENGSESSSSLYVKDIICYVPTNASKGTLLFVDSALEASSDGPISKVPAVKIVTADRLPPLFQERCLISPLWQSILGHGALRTDFKCKPNIDVVVSTHSGARLARQFFRDAIKPILDHLDRNGGLNYSVHFTQSAKTISEVTIGSFLPRAEQGLSQLIILLSGDGGISDVINGLMTVPHGEAFVKPTVALIPMGTGSALAHSTSIMDDNTLGLAPMMRGQPYPLPLFRASFSPLAKCVVREKQLPVSLEKGHTNVMYGAVVCSWGLHAALVADSDTAEYRKYGAERFRMAAKENLYPHDGSEPHRYRAKVSLLGLTAGGQPKPLQRQEHSYVLATMVSKLEKDFTISPNSKPLDGKLRLVHFGPKTGDEAMRIINLAYQNGQHVHDDAVGYEEDLDGFRIDFEGCEDDARWRRICIDGEIVTVEKDGWVEVRKVQDEAIDVLYLKSSELKV